MLMYEIENGCLAWDQESCRINLSRFLANCHKNQGSFVFGLHLDSVFSCTVLFVSISQVIGCEDCLCNDLHCVGWGVKLYSSENGVSVGQTTDVCCYRVLARRYFAFFSSVLQPVAFVLVDHSNNNNNSINLDVSRNLLHKEKYALKTERLIWYDDVLFSALSSHLVAICDRMFPPLKSTGGESFRGKIWGGRGWPM